MDDTEERIKENKSHSEMKSKLQRAQVRIGTIVKVQGKMRQIKKERKNYKVI